MSTFEDNFEKIFGTTPKRESGSFVQDPVTHRLVPRGTSPDARVNAPMVMGLMKEFRSPIDQTVISNRSQLAAHNKKHGVTNAQDYSGGYIEKKAHERVNAGAKDLKESRKRDVTHMIDRILK